MRIIQVCYKIQDFNYLVVIVFFAAGAAVYAFAALMLKKRVWRILLCASLAVSYGVILIFKSQNIRDAYDVLITSMKEVYTAISIRSDTYFYQYLPLFVLILPIVAAAAAGLKKRAGYVVAVVITFLMVLLWLAGFDNDVRYYSYACLFLNALLCGLEICRSSINRFCSMGYKISLNRSSITSHVLILSCIITIFSFVLVRGLGVKSIPEAIQQTVAKSNRLQERFKQNRYDLSRSGYGGDSVYALGGPIILDTDIAMRVKSDDSYYLRGIVKDFYDGSTWRKSDIKYVKKGDKPVRTISDDFIRYMGAGSNKIDIRPIKTKRIIIYPEELETSTMFAPDNTYNVNTSSGIVGWDNTRSFMMMTRDAVKESYTVDFFKSEAGIEVFPNVYNLETGFEYPCGKDILPQNKDYYDEFIGTAYGMYLQIPDNISRGTRALVEEITEDCNTTAEKVNRIQEYLSSNYTYSLDALQPPEGQEFIGHFLFSERKGYCTYFATAATIMCRIAGIPARYVEGFNMGDKKDRDGLYIVSNDMAHAWTEVLVSPRSDLWTVVDCVPLEREDIRYAIYANIEKYKGGAASMDGRDLPEDTQGLFYRDSRKSSGNMLLYSVMFIAALFFSASLYTIVRIIRFNEKRRQMLDSKSMIPIYRYTKKRLASSGITATHANDDIKWAEDMEDAGLRAWLESMVASVYREFYGKKGRIDFDRKGLYDFIEYYIRKRQNILMYFMRKYII